MGSKRQRLSSAIAVPSSAQGDDQDDQPPARRRRADAADDDDQDDNDDEEARGRTGDHVEEEDEDVGGGKRASGTRRSHEEGGERDQTEDPRDGEEGHSSKRRRADKGDEGDEGAAGGGGHYGPNGGGAEDPADTPRSASTGGFGGRGSFGLDAELRSAPKPETQEAYEDDKVKKRNRRMFGALMGHLGNARKGLQRNESLLKTRAKGKWALAPPAVLLSGRTRALSLPPCLPPGACFGHDLSRIPCHALPLVPGPQLRAYALCHGVSVGLPAPACSGGGREDQAQGEWLQDPSNGAGDVHEGERAGSREAGFHSHPDPQDRARHAHLRVGEAPEATRCVRPLERYCH